MQRCHATNITDIEFILLEQQTSVASLEIPERGVEIFTCLPSFESPHDITNTRTSTRRDHIDIIGLDIFNTRLKH